MNIQISVDGIGEVMNKLEDLVSGDKIHKALEEGGEVVRDDAVLNCPVDTGHLQGSITSAVEGNSAVIGTNVEYAAYVEFGTGSKGDPSVAHTSKKHWTYYKGGRFYTTSGQAPRAYLVPALKNNVSKIIEAFRAAYES